MALTLRSLLFMGGLGAVLIVWNIYALHRDTELATGPKSEAQEAFFVDAADRPDISLFFRKLTAKQRLAMAQDIGRYTDPQLGKLCGTLLGDFDPAARAALADSMGNVAVVHPQEVADQFNQKGSFQ